MKYALDIVYESPMPDGGFRQSCQADERYERGDLFYGQYGRAIVSKCYPLVDPQIKTHNTLYGEWRIAKYGR